MDGDTGIRATTGVVRVPLLLLLAAVVFAALLAGMLPGTARAQVPGGNGFEKSITANDDQFRVETNTAKRLLIAANDESSPNVINTIFTLETAPQHGTVSQGGEQFDGMGEYRPLSGFNNSATYEPAPGYEGTDSFVYRVCDAPFANNNREQPCDTATVSITVGPGVPDPQTVTAQDDVFVTRSGGDVELDVLANDVEADGDRLQAIFQRGPERGKIEQRWNGEYIYHAPIGWEGGTITLPYLAADERGGFSDSTDEDEATVTITVADAVPEPDDPGCRRVVALGVSAYSNGFGSGAFGGSGDVYKVGGVDITENRLVSYHDVDRRFEHGYSGFEVSYSGTSPRSAEGGIVTRHPFFPEDDNGDGVVEDKSYVVKSAVFGGTLADIVQSRKGSPHTPQPTGGVGLQKGMGSSIVYQCPAAAIPEATKEPLPRLLKEHEDYAEEFFESRGGDKDPRIGNIDLTGIEAVRIAYAADGFFADSLDVELVNFQNSFPGGAPSVFKIRLNPGGDLPDGQGGQDGRGVTHERNGSYDANIPQQFRVNGWQLRVTEDNPYNGMQGLAYDVELSGRPVSAANVLPNAEDDQAETPQGTPKTVDVLANDRDGDGDGLTIVSHTQPSNGTAECDADDCRYLPRPDFVGTDSFTYTISDGKGGRDTATVTVVVREADAPPPDDPEPKPKPPVARDDAAKLKEGGSVSLNVLKNDSDPDGPESALRVKGGTKPKHGRAFCSPGGTCRYESDKGYSGRDSFRYTVRDEQGLTDSALVRLLVTPKATPKPPPPPVPPEVGRCVREPGAASIRGREGAAIIDGTFRGEVIKAREDATVVRGGGGNDVIFVASGASAVEGNGGNDIIIYSAPGASAVKGGTGNDLICLYQGAASAKGESGDDVIHGNAGASALDVGTGDDRLYGRGTSAIEVEDGRGGDYGEHVGPGASACSGDRGDTVRGCTVGNTGGRRG